MLRPIIFALTLLAAASGLQAAPAKPKRVVIVVPHPLLNQAVDTLADSLRESFSKNSTGRIEVLLHHAYVNLPRDAALKQVERQWLTALVRRDPPDLILAIGVDSLEYVQAHPDLWQGIPCVYLIEDEFIKQRPTLRLPPVGIRSLGLDASGTVTLALRLFPKTTTLVLVGGASEMDKAFNANIVRMTEAHHPQLRIVDLTEMRFADQRARVKKLGPNTVVLIGALSGDQDDRLMVTDLLTSEMIRTVNAPVFGLMDTVIGKGIVGGSVYVIEKSGKRLAEVAMQVLNGNPPKESLKEKFSSVVLDGRQLERWNVADSRIPEGAHIEYPRFSIWKTYWKQIVSISILLLAQAALIFGLLVERRLRRRSQAELDRRLLMEQMVSSVSASFSSEGTHFTEESFAEALRHIASASGSDRAGIWSLSSGDAYFNHVCCFPEAAGLPKHLPVIGSGPSGSVARGTEFHVRTNEDMAWESPERALASSLGLQSMLWLPLRGPGGTAGALCLARSRAGDWPDHVLEPLRTVTEILGGVFARMASESAMRSSEELYRAVLASTPGMVTVLDRNGTVVTRNSRRLPAGVPLSDLTPGMDYLAFWRRLSASPDLDVKQVERAVSGVLEGTQTSVVLDVHMEPSWLRVFVEPLAHKEGGAVVAHTDITERKRDELEAARNLDLIAHMNRVAGMGEMAASLAHELNQPLAAIGANAEALLHLVPAAGEPNLEEAREAIGDIVSDNRRAGEVIRRMRALLRRSPAEVQRVGVNDLVTETVDLLRNEALLRKIAFHLELSDGLPEVQADSVQMQQVVLNLARNAMDAVSESGAARRSVTIRTNSPQPGLYVELTVQDSGPGIAQECLDRLFEPFFSTKPQGLGMGLSISRSIVQSIGGRISASNLPGGGAAFVVTIPVASEARLGWRATA